MLLGDSVRSFWLCLDRKRLFRPKPFVLRKTLTVRTVIVKIFWIIISWQVDALQPLCPGIMFCFIRQHVHLAQIAVLTLSSFLSVSSAYVRARLFLFGCWPSNVQWQAKLKHSQALLPNTYSSRHVTNAFSCCLASESCTFIFNHLSPGDLTDLILSSVRGSDLPPRSSFRVTRSVLSVCLCWLRSRCGEGEIWRCIKIHYVSSRLYNSNRTLLFCTSSSVIRFYLMLSCPHPGMCECNKVCVCFILWANLMTN